MKYRLWFTSLMCMLLLLVPAVTQAVVEIDYWGYWAWDPYTQIEPKVVEAFNEQFAGRYQVNLISVPDGVEAKLPIAIAGGAPPAVAKLDRFQVGTFASQALVQPLDPFISRDRWNMKEYYPATRDEAFYRGSYYGIPWNTDDRALYYNKDMFNDMGLDAERPPQTWEEVIEYSRKIDRFTSEGQIEKATLVPHWGNWYFLGWLYTAGGDLLDPTDQKVIWDNDTAVRTLEFMQERLQHYGGAAALDALNGLPVHHRW